MTCEKIRRFNIKFKNEKESEFRIHWSEYPTLCTGGFRYDAPRISIPPYLKAGALNPHRIASRTGVILTDDD